MRWNDRADRPDPSHPTRMSGLALIDKDIGNIILETFNKI